jgi:spermidine synthase
MSVRSWCFGLSALVVAFSSMAYELALAQSIAVIYGDTITSYSLAIGFFVLGLGLGAAYWAKLPRPPTLTGFWGIEMVLAILGAVAPFLIFWSEFGGDGVLPWGMLSGLGLALAIGIFSGMEIPLLIALAHPRSEREFRTTRLIVGLDFMGTFAAAAIVPLILFVSVGLVGVPLIGALLNVLLAGIALAFSNRSPMRVVATLAVGVGLVLALTRVSAIETYLAAGVF